MNKYAVKVAYGLPGQNKSSSQVVHVEAESDSSASRLAVAKFKVANSKMDAVAVEVKRK